MLKRIGLELLNILKGILKEEMDDNLILSKLKTIQEQKISPTNPHKNGTIKLDYFSLWLTFDLDKIRKLSSISSFKML